MEARCKAEGDVQNAPEVSQSRRTRVRQGLKGHERERRGEVEEKYESHFTSPPP